jgi:FkbM family methyltransferase
MIAPHAKDAAQALVKKGVPGRLERKLFRELKKARAQGILDGVLAMLRPGEICIDCGAHVGEVSLALAAKGAQVHAFEPDPSTYAKLQAATKMLPNITTHPAAVGVTSGTAKLYRSNRSATSANIGARGSTLIAESSIATDTEAAVVEVIDFPCFLAGLIKRHGEIAFLKMDIEGAELDLLEALIETELLTKMRLTVVETHRWLLAGQSHRFDRLHKLAKERPELNLFLGWI